MTGSPNRNRDLQRMKNKAGIEIIAFQWSTPQTASLTNYLEHVRHLPNNFNILAPFYNGLHGLREIQPLPRCSESKRKSGKHVHSWLCKVQQEKTKENQEKSKARKKNREGRQRQRMEVAVNRARNADPDPLIRPSAS